MAQDASVDRKKRRFLIGATTAIGGIGTVAAAVPFALSFWPSERAKAAGAPVEVDVSKLEPGQKINVEWRGKVVWVISRTPEMLKNLPKLHLAESLSSLEDRHRTIQAYAVEKTVLHDFLVHMIELPEKLAK